mgnify:FL=1
MIVVLFLVFLAGSGCAVATRALAPPAAAAAAAGAPAGVTPGGREMEELTRRLDALGSRSNDLENAIARVGARVEALERRLDALAAQLAHARASRAPSAAEGDATAAAPAPGEGREGPEQRAGGGAAPGAPGPTARDLYQAGMAKFRAGEAAQAVLIFYDLIARYPLDLLRESAQFQVGEIFFREREFREALREFEDLLAAVPSGARTADVLLKIGLSYRSLKDEASARQAWERLTREYPASAASRQARVLLRSPRPR